MFKNPASNAGDVGLIPGLGIKIPHTVQCSKTKQTHTWGGDDAILKHKTTLHTLTAFRKRLAVEILPLGKKIYIFKSKRCVIFMIISIIPCAYTMPYI